MGSYQRGELIFYLNFLTFSNTKAILKLLLILFISNSSFGQEKYQGLELKVNFIEKNFSSSKDEINIYYLVNYTITNHTEKTFTYVKESCPFLNINYLNSDTLNLKSIGRCFVHFNEFQKIYPKGSIINQVSTFPYNLDSLDFNKFTIPVIIDSNGYISHNTSRFNEYNKIIINKFDLICNDYFETKQKYSFINNYEQKEVLNKIEIRDSKFLIDSLIIINPPFSNNALKAIFGKPKTKTKNNKTIFKWDKIGIIGKSNKNHEIITELIFNYKTLNITRSKFKTEFIENTFNFNKFKSKEDLIKTGYKLNEDGLYAKKVNTYLILVKLNSNDSEIKTIILKSNII